MIVKHKVRTDLYSNFDAKDKPLNQLSDADDSLEEEYIDAHMVTFCESKSGWWLCQFWTAIGRSNGLPTYSPLLLGNAEKPPGYFSGLICDKEWTSYAALYILTLQLMMTQ